MTKDLPPTTRGFIARRCEFSVFCGKCHEERTLYQGSERYDMVKAVRDARKYGWKRTREDGWVCPKHK